MFIITCKFADGSVEEECVSVVLPLIGLKCLKLIGPKCVSPCIFFHIYFQ